MGSYNFWAADRFTLGVTLHFLISREPLRHRFPKVLTLYFTTPACIYSLLFPLKCRYIRECHPYLIFPFIFLFCLKWRECWIGSEPSVITWNINANEEVCRRVNEVSVMWLSGSVHRRTSVVFIWTSHFFKLSLWFVTVYSLCWVVSHDFIIKRATLSLVFLSGNKRQRYFTSHLIPGLWKQSPFEVAVVWMCHWKLIRYSWLEVENVLWPWYQGFSYAALSFCQKNLQVERGLFCLQIINFLAATNLALPSLQALLIMVYLKSTWKLVSTFRNQRIPAWQLSNICVVLLHCFTLACQLLPV